jgi:hypothetical protein
MSLVQAVQTTAFLPLRPPQPLKVTTKSPQSADLCKLFGTACAVNHCICLFQGDANVDEYGVYSANGNETLHKTSGITLSQALGTDDLHRVQRCQIASTLASSHLQLHSSPWLHHVWSSENILLPATQDASNARAISTEPYVLADLAATPTSWPSKDPSFTSLGIVLLELCFDQRFTENKLWQKYPGKEDDSLIRLAIAQKLAERVAEEAGDDYSTAVSWALKQAPVNLTDDSWRVDFAENVVQPLQRCCDFLRPRC